MDEPRPWSAFLGTWILEPASCHYEQGAPPRAGRYVIAKRDDGELEFTVSWTDAAGKSDSVSFSAPPDGRRIPMGDGELIDALSVSAVSSRELNSSGWIGDREVMVAQRQLDDRGEAMRVTQLVRLPDGSRPANVAIYRRAPRA